MTEFAQLIASLRRPRLLLSAARHGVADYNRNRDLKRLLAGATPTPLEAVGQLIEAEEELETARLSGGAAYSVARHVDVLIAILAEFRLLASARPV